MAAYAAAVSLMHILDTLKNHPSPPICFDSQQFDSLTEIVTFLQEFLEGYVSPFEYSDEADPLEMRIAEAAYAAEDVIESYIVNNIELELAAASTPQNEGDDAVESYKLDNIQLASAEPITQDVRDVDDAAQATHHEDEQTRCFNFCGGLRKVKERMGLIKKVAEIEMGKQKARVEYKLSTVDSLELYEATRTTHHEDEESRYFNFYAGMQKVIEAMDKIKKEAMAMAMAMEMKTDMDRGKGGVLAAEVQTNVSKSSSIESKSEMVGFDEMRLQLLDKLTGTDSKCQIIPIVGMGGIGKTTLARNVFDGKLIKEHFDICVWTTISLDHDIERTLREVLSRCKGKEYLSGEKSVEELGLELHRHLFGRRYLIVLDDMWSVEVWDKIGNFFPDCSQRSRIIVTTRILTLADLLTNSSNSLCLSFLNEVDSWTLFSNTVFGIGSEECVPELREIGEKIVRKCKGLPLSIAVIGGLLAISELTQGYWKYVEANLNSIVNMENEEYCSRVLKLSYNHLPVHLKPCFMYMGVFDEDHTIRKSELIRLWISEGFLKIKKNKSMRTIAKEFLKELLDRNLIILVCELDRWENKYIKYLKIHDLLRDLSLKEAEKQKFYYNLRKLSAHPIDSQRRIVIPGNTYSDHFCAERMTHARSFLSHIPYDYPLPQCKLLRIVNMINPKWDIPYGLDSYSNDEKIFRLVNLRQLVIGLIGRKYDHQAYMIPSCIKMFWNLRTLIVKNYADHINIIALVEIWKMHQLEHVELVCSRRGRLCLPHPPPPSGDEDMIIMNNLHTLIGEMNFDLNEDTVKGIPNIKKLKLIFSKFDVKVEGLCHLGCLRQLENLRLTLRKCYNDMNGSLKKLALIFTIDWGNTMLQDIGSLPLLQELKLSNFAFGSPTWETVEGQFPSLSSLTLHKCSGLKKWTVSGSFPLLRDLGLSHVGELEEIPLEIGERGMLISISLLYCPKSVAESAIKILEEEEEMNGEQSNLHVRVTCYGKSQAEALQGLSASPNLLVHVEN